MDLMELKAKEWMSILKIIVVIVLLLLVCKILKSTLDYFKTFIIPAPTNMETIKCNSILFFMFYFRNLYTQSRLSNSSIPSMLVQALHGFCSEVFAKERVFWMYLFHKPGIVIFKPETAQAVLSISTMINKSVHYNFIHSWLGTGLFTSSGEKWRQRRKLLTPTFHFSILENFLPVLNEQSSILVSRLKSLSREPWVDIVPLTALCTLDIICQTAMGVKINAQRNGNKEYVRSVHELAGAIVNRILRPWLYLDIIYYLTAQGKKYKANLQQVHGLTRKVIKDKKSEILELDTFKQKKEDPQFPVKKRKAFLELLLEYHFKDPSLTEEDIKEEVDTFMFGGHDTTGMGISWILYCIGLYPEVQKKVVEELDEIFQDDAEREVTREDLTKMKYLECTIKETLRLYPPGPFLLRECNETIEVLNHQIFSGSFTFIFIYALHRDPESFPDPEKFIPERFFPENSKDRHPYAYIPFSAGVRNCIGQKFAMMELKTVVANVLRHLHITSLDPRDKVLVNPVMTLQNAKPLRLRFEMRQKRE